MGEGINQTYGSGSDLGGDLGRSWEGIWVGVGRDLGRSWEGIWVGVGRGSGTDLIISYYKERMIP